MSPAVVPVMLNGKATSPVPFVAVHQLRSMPCKVGASYEALVALYTRYRIGRWMIGGSPEAPRGRWKMITSPKSPYVR